MHNGKAYIMTDLEGVSGVNGRGDAVGNKIINEDEAGRLLTEEVNAVVEGLIQAGAAGVDVVDGHGGSNMIRIERLHPAASLMTLGGGFSPVSMISGTYEVGLHVGAHAMQGVKDGYLNHTFSSHSVVEMLLNGRPVGEIAIIALICAYFGMPTILVSGDDAACREARDVLGKVMTVTTKHALGRYTVMNRNPEAVRKELRQAARTAFKNRNRYPVKLIPPPYELKIKLMCPNHADACEMSGAKRLDANIIQYESDNFIDLWAQRYGWAPGIHNRRFNIPPAGKK